MGTNITPHFTLEELCQTETDHPNIPRGPIRERLWHVAFNMESVRRILGDKPVIITSGYRSPAVNALVGGVPDSDHVLGYACDFHRPGMRPFEIVDRIDKSPLFFAQMINEQEKGVVHLSFNPLKPIREVLTLTETGYVAGNRPDPE